MNGQPMAHFEPTQIEVGTGNGYRWSPAVYIITPDGAKLFPPMLITEARAYCKREGWTIDKNISSKVTT